MKRDRLKKAACCVLAFVLALALLPAFSAIAAAAGPGLPEVFDLRSVDTDGDGIGDACWVTPVKCQDPFGTCWGFAAVAAAETSILSSGLAAVDGYAAYADPENGLKELNLSEKHLAYFALKTIDDPRDPQYGEGMRFTGPEDSSDIYDTGGTSWYATTLFAAGIGPVHEELDEQFVYRGKNGLIQTRDKGGKIVPVYYSKEDDWSIDGDLRFYQSYVLKESFVLESPSGKSGEDWENAVNAMKEILYSGHAINLVFYADVSTPGQEAKTEYLSEHWAQYVYEPVGENHGVTVIGWDDHYPKENFAHKTLDGEDAPLPERDGAWLVRNSWGSQEPGSEFPYNGDWGLLQGQDKGVYNAETGRYAYDAVEDAVHTGYFWLSYCDKGIAHAEALEFDSVTAEEGYYIAEHDYMPVGEMASMSFPKEISMANVFCVGDELDAARIEMVSCQTFDPGVDLHVDVYLLDEDWKSPTDGVIVSQADADCRYGGFHKLVLDTPAVILRDRYFSVVATQRTADGAYVLNFQLGLNKTYADEFGEPDYAVSVVNPRESFLGGGDDWTDFSEAYSGILESLTKDYAVYYAMDNCPIKAYLAIPSEAEVPRGAADYADLEPGAWYYDAASWILDNDIAAGTMPDAFSPADPCSRAQTVTWLWRAAGMPEPETTESPFRDVTKDDYFYYAALWAAENGVVDGVSDGVFAPGRAVTRAQMAAILYRYEKLRGGGFTGLWAFRLDYADAEAIPEWAYEPFCWLTMNGVFEGDGVNVRPNGACTRAHAVCVLQRYFAPEAQ